MYKKRQRIMAWIMALLFITMTAFSVFFLIEEANHECIGEDCPICETVVLVEKTLQQLSNGLAEVFQAWMPVLFVLFIISSYICFRMPITLVHQKVRLND